MKKGFNKLIVIFLMMSMIFTSVSLSFAQTDAFSGDLNGAIENENIIEENTEDGENKDQDVLDNQASEENKPSKEASDSKATSNINSINEKVSDEMKVIYVESPKLEAPAKQNIAIIWDNNLSQVKDANLVVTNPSGKEIIIPEAKRTDKAILFSRDFSKSELGVYKVKEITYFVDGREEKQVLNFADVEINDSFEVVDQLSDDQSGEGVATIDVSGSTVDKKEVQDQINSAIQEIDKVRTFRAKKGPIVVVLNPGHGGVDPGACANGLKEKDLTLKIAKYCKAELEKYADVEVYLTRTTDTTDPGYYQDKALENIVKFAYNKNADILVSIHINSGGGKGAEIWYPNNSSYRNELHQSGGKISNSILSEIKKLGLSSRGIKTKNDSGPVTYYPDGSVADWYGIIRKARKAGILGIIVEHAFIDNASDAQFLKSEANLQKLGIADAVGIANYYGLTKGTWEKTEEGTKYKKPDGTYAVGWQSISSKWYYFNSEGYMQTGWICISNKWYYLSDSGVMQTGWKLVDGKWYYMNSSGERQTGWIKVGGKSYYLYADGHMAANERTPDGYYVDSNGVYKADKWMRNSTGWWYQYGEGTYAKGWAKIAGNHYYFNKNGYMQTGWQYISGKWYYLRSSGERMTGWIKVGGKSYYLYKDGHMAARERTPDGYYVNGSGVWIPDKWKKNSVGWWYQYGEGTYAVGWAKIAGNHYYFNKRGYMQTGWQYIDNKWYYMSSSGARKTGWIKLSGKYYFLYPDGHMAANEVTPDGYYVDGNGVWIQETKHRIDGSSSVTASKLKALYLKQSPVSYPSFYKNTDAPTLDAFCNLYVEEAKKENIKPEVAFCQAMLETGWLTFKGSVKINQFNFAGLGAVSSTAAGASFSSARIGIRAQVQHLKAYANTAPLNYAQVDPRFGYVKRGSAPYVEWLGQKENPNGYGWATAKGYGTRILNVMKQL